MSASIAICAYILLKAYKTQRQNVTVFDIACICPAVNGLAVYICLEASDLKTNKTVTTTTGKDV
jgi:hypothetical protein